MEEKEANATREGGNDIYVITEDLAEIVNAAQEYVKENK